MSDFERSADIDTYISRRRRRRNVVIAAILLLAAAPIILLFSARAFELRVTPSEAADTFSLQRSCGVVLTFGSRALLLSEQGCVDATAKGYAPETVQLAKASGQQQIEVALRPLPGKVVIAVDSAAEFEVFVDRNALGGASVIEVLLERGPHGLQVRGPRIMPIERSIDIIGYGEEQRFEFATEPSNSTFSVRALPGEAEILLDGVPVGQAAYADEVALGAHEVEVRLDGYHSVVRQFIAEPNSLADLGVIQLKPRDATLSLSSAPTGASVLVDGQFVGEAPLRIRLAALRTHGLTIRKSGHEAVKVQIRPAPGEVMQRTVRLGANSIDAHVSTDIEARLTVNGIDRGKTPMQVQVQQGDRIGVVREGYQTQSVTVAEVGGPKRTYAFEMMRPEEWAFQQAPEVLEAADGSTLRKFPPVRFRPWPANGRGQGAEKILKRAFYVGQREVDYDGFRSFDPITIPSGLSGKHPVANVTWKRAAEFCNWLSRREGLEPVYEFGERGELRRVVTGALGYRLPTEAEWEAVSGYDFSRNQPVGPYPWGPSATIPRAYGNFAGREAQASAGRLLAGHADNHAATAPTGSYPANFNGLYDLAGNVAEWTTDYYGAASPGAKGQALVDPLGPARGVDHVVKGSSFKSHALSALVSGHRTFESTKSDAVGFRIAKWIH